MSGDTGSGSLKHRAPKKKASFNDLNGGANNADSTAVKAKQEVKETVGSQWDFKVALVILTVLGFATRFYGITHPNSVVFDEVHFGKVGCEFFIGDKLPLTKTFGSSHHTTSNERTSSTCTLPSLSSSSPSSAG
jgi:hypothetical protein